MKKVRTILVLLFISFAILGHRSVQATSLSIIPSSETVNLGETFSLDIGISVSDPVSIILLDISYNPDILNFSYANDPEFLKNYVQCSELPCNDDTLFEVTPYDGGVIIDSMFWNSTLNEINYNSFATGSAMLASLHFDAKGVGTSPVLFEVATAWGSDLIEVSFETIPGEVNVVPEPSTLILVASGLIASLGARRFKKKV